MADPFETLFTNTEDKKKATNKTSSLSSNDPFGELFSNSNSNNTTQPTVAPEIPKSSISNITPITPINTRTGWQKFKDTYMSISNNAADISEELPLGIYKGITSVPSGLLNSIQSLKSLTGKAVESQVKGGIGYKIASKLFPEVVGTVEKGVEKVVNPVLNTQDEILNIAKQFTNENLKQPAEKQVEEYRTKTGDKLSGTERFIEGLGYTLASMAPAFATAGAGASPLASAFIGGIIEAGQNTDQLADEIDNRTDLTKQQKQDRKDTMFVSSIMASTIADRFGIFGDTKSLFTRLINTELTEIPEEVGTQFMQNLLSDKPLKEGLGQTALFTALMAPLLGGLGHSVQPTSEEEIIKSLEKNQEFQSFDDTQKQQVVDTILNMQNTIVKNEDIADIASQFTEAYDKEFEQDKSFLKEENKVDEALFKEKSTEQQPTYNKAIPVLKAFESSQPIETYDNGIVLGTFGKKTINRKTDNQDRFPVLEIPETLNNIVGVFKASSDTNNYRSDNMAIISEMPNGEKRVIYTRKNQQGNEEIINAHIISNEQYIADLEKNGVPERTRTSNLTDRSGALFPLSYGNKKSISESVKQGQGGGVDNSKERKPRTDEPFISTTKGRKQAGLKPVGEGETKTSSLFERVKDQVLKNEGVDYNVATRDVQIKKATDFVNEYFDRALKISQGRELTPEGILKNDIMTAVRIKLQEEGRISEASDILTAQTLQATRYGQEIQALAGVDTPDTISYWYNEITRNRVGEIANQIVYEYKKKGRTVKKEDAVKTATQEGVKEVKEVLTKSQIKLNKAQEILDALTCNI